MIKTAGAIAALTLALAAGGVARADAPPQAPASPPNPNENLGGGTAAGAERPWAKGVSPAEQQAALDLFREGNQLLNSGLLEQAAEKYRAALAHWDHPAINYNLALALRNLKQPLEVDAALRKALQYGPEPLDKDKFELAKQYLEINSQLLAEIEVTCDKPGADVAIDGQHLFTGPGKVSKLVKIGKHTIVAQKPGAISRIRASDIGPQEHFRVELKLYTPEELTRYRRHWERTWAPYAAIAAGAVVAGVGGLFELSARSSFRNFDAEIAKCGTVTTTPVTSTTGCPTNDTYVANLRKDGETKQSIAYVGYGIGAAGIVAGGLLAVINRRQPYQIRAEDIEDDREPMGVSVTPVVTPTMAGAALQGHF